MPGHCILCHGFESGPDATKVTALAEVAQRLAWTHERPDFTDLDAKREVSGLGDVPARLQRLLEIARSAAARGPLVLAGSSLGAFISARVSLEVPVLGLFLMAPPVWLEDFDMALQIARVPTWIIHGWHDEIITAMSVAAWAQPRDVRTVFVPDSHRLEGHVDFCGQEFGRFLQSLM